MKRLVLVAMTLFLLIPCLSIPILGAETVEETRITYMEDGSYLVETVQIVDSRASGSKTGTKTKTYYESDGTASWKATLTGKFTYDGTSATCTVSTVSVTIYDANWYTVSKSATKSGNTASASVTMGYKTMGITTNKVTISVSLSCDKDGNFS